MEFLFILYLNKTPLFVPQSSVLLHAFTIILNNWKRLYFHFHKSKGITEIMQILA